MIPESETDKHLAKIFAILKRRLRRAIRPLFSWHFSNVSC